MMGLIIPFILMGIVLIAFNFSIELIVDTFPSTYDLFTDNTIAMVIFVFSFITQTPFFIAAIIALIIGIFAADVWYAPAIQYLALEGVFALLSFVLTMIFGSAIAITSHVTYNFNFSSSPSLLTKIKENKIIVWIKSFLSFSGRYNRKKYFIESLKLAGLYILIGLCFAFLHLLIKNNNIFMPIFAVTFIPFCLILFVKYISNVVKRCHDLGYPTSAGTIVAILLIAANGTENIAAAFLTTFVALYLLFKKGTIGPNQYGEDPLSKE